MSLDSSFHANFSIISIPQENADDRRHNHRVVKSNDTIYFCSTLNVTFDANTFLYQSYVVPLDEFMNPLTCAQNTINTYNEPYYYEIPIGHGVDTGFDYSVIDTLINIAYYESSSTLNIFDVLANTTVIDLTECIWPRFDLAYNECAFPLPEFILNDSYLIKIGTNPNIEKFFTIIPFEHCQNSKYSIEVVDASTNIKPSWISINQQNETVIIDTSNILSEESFTLSFSARLVTFSDDQSNRYTTPGFSSIIKMENSNCNLISHNITDYFIINKTSNFTIKFEDDEGDYAKIKIQESQYFSSFVKYISSSTINILIQAEGTSGDLFEFVFYYTDSFHQSDSDWKIFTKQIIMFVSEPPMFNANLDKITVDQCQDYKFTLPSFSDLDSYNISIKLANGVPSWIYLKNNYIISINSNSGKNITEGLTEIGLILIDETNSWSNYTLNIFVEPKASPKFGFIPNIQQNQLQGVGVFINISYTNPVYVVDCNSNTIINELVVICSRLKINSEQLSYNQTCLKLVSLDSCSNKIYSNTFYLILNDSKPPTLAHSLDPFTVPKGIYTLFELPFDLFIDCCNEPLTYNASLISCSQNNSIDIGVNSTTNEKIYLYVFSNYPMSCKGFLTASNKYQTSGVEIALNIVSCSSKNCIKCFGPYQNQCIECESEYMLDKSGICLRKIEFFIFQNLNLYKICGIITLAFIIIRIMLSIYFGRSLLNNISCLQLIISFILCTNKSYTSINNFLSNILFIKFDFGFIQKFTFDSTMMGCDSKSDKMSELQFYCHSTFQNYFFLILLISTSTIIWTLIILIFKRKRVDSFLIKMQSMHLFKNSNNANHQNYQHFMEWFILNLMMMFILISIADDFVDFLNHIFLSFLTLILIIIACIYLYITQFRVFKLCFIKEMEPEYCEIGNSKLFKL